MSLEFIDMNTTDNVSFYIRKDFSDLVDEYQDFTDKNEEKETRICVTQFIERSDIFSMRFYVKKYMDTAVEIARPNTPAKLIIYPIPKDFTPKY